MPNDEQFHFGRTVWWARDAKGWTHTNFARRIGEHTEKGKFTTRQLDRIYKRADAGSFRPTLHAIAKALGTTLDELEEKARTIPAKTIPNDGVGRPPSVSAVLHCLRWIVTRPVPEQREIVKPIDRDTAEHLAALFREHLESAPKPKPLSLPKGRKRRAG